MNSRKWRPSVKSFFLNYTTLCTQVNAEGANGLTTAEAEKVQIEKNYYSGKFTKKQQVQS